MVGWPGQERTAADSQANSVSPPETPWNSADKLLGVWENSVSVSSSSGPRPYQTGLERAVFKTGAKVFSLICAPPASFRRHDLDAFAFTRCAATERRPGWIIEGGATQCCNPPRRRQSTAYERTGNLQHNRTWGCWAEWLLKVQTPSSRRITTNKTKQVIFTENVSFCALV